MKLIVDGYVYQARQPGGISRLFTEILARMCEMEPSLRVTLLHSGRSRQPLPSHRAIHPQITLPLEKVVPFYKEWHPVPQKVRQLMQQITVGSPTEAIWHSTYFTEPGRWKGPIVVTVYDMIYERFPDQFNEAIDHYFTKQKRSSVSSADRIICISETTLQDVVDFYDIRKENACVIPLAAGPAFCRLEGEDCSLDPELPGDRPFLLYVGRRRRYKNFRTLWNAYLAWNHRKDVDLVVVGPEWSDEERSWLVDAKCPGKVHLIQGTTDELLVRLYNRARALVYPSLYEGFGIPLLEAMACGCPVVASRIPTTVELAGRQPFYFEPESVDDLVSALDAALFDGRQAERTEAGLRIARTYSWDRCAAETLQVYSSLGAP